ncbi:MAG: hypothetical protein AAB968_04340 [Patescibacteria group bacterium]
MEALFNSVLVVVAKIGFALFLFLILLRWLLIIPYVWFKYDKPITNLKNELDKFRKEQRQRAVAQPFIDRHIVVKTQEINEELDILEIKRRLFLDRVNLLLSIISVDKK